jgi:hypothetical protein
MTERRRASRGRSVAIRAIKAGREEETLLADEERADDNDGISLLWTRDEPSCHVNLPIHNTIHR